MSPSKLTFSSKNNTEHALHLVYLRHSIMSNPMQYTCMVCTLPYAVYLCRVQYGRQLFSGFVAGLREIWKIQGGRSDSAGRLCRHPTVYQQLCYLA